MLNSLAIFCAVYLVFIQAAGAGWVVFRSLRGKPRQLRNRFLLAAGCMAVVSMVAALVASKLHSDPRPFVSDGLPSLIHHAANNGFPSDHSLLAAALVAAVGMVELSYVPAFAVVAALVGWGRVACHVHHTQDVVGSFVIVTLAWMFSVRVTRSVMLAIRSWQQDYQSMEEGVDSRISYKSAGPIRRGRPADDQESNLA